jgi:fumarate hydratase class I
MLPEFFRSVLDLVIKTSTELPPDVRAAMKAASNIEPPDTRSGQALSIINLNIDQASDCEGAICQDTGMLTFEIMTPGGADHAWMEDEIRKAVAEATKRGKLRPNSVDSITGKNSGNNLGPGTPVIHFHQWTQDAIEVKLILKGGGCENCNAQYAVPVELAHLGRVDRNLDGVRKCILHAVWQAQGKGCSPGVVGVCVGGDRATGYAHAKQQLFRTIDDVNPDPTLAELEATVMRTVNTLQIGAMGFLGNTTLIGCKIGALNRLPACFFVSVAYECWAFRRLGVVLNAQSGAITSWLYRDPLAPIIPMADQAGFTRTGREVTLTAPFDEAAIRSLKVGDVVLLNGRMFTGRDSVHAYLTKNDAPVDLQGAAIYHCGPVAVKDGDHWKMNAAGPTTSIREEPYQADVIRKFGLRVIIGKGGMGAKTLEALKECGAVYVSAIGGAAQYYARTIERVDGVSLFEFGVPEALWHLHVKDFPVIVTMDSHGNSLHKDVEESSAKALAVLK